VYGNCSYQVGLLSVGSSCSDFRNFSGLRSFNPHHHDKVAETMAGVLCDITVYKFTVDTDIVGSDQAIYPRSQAPGLSSTHLYTGVPRVNATELVSSRSSRVGSAGNSTSLLF